MPNLIDVEANCFALELLVPRKLLLPKLKNETIDFEDDKLIKKLAQDFKVSQFLIHRAILNNVLLGNKS